MLTLARLAAAAFLCGALTAPPAAAFSQIGTKDGAAPQREGIVAVPLPPLPGASRPAEPPPGPGATETQPAGTTLPAPATPADAAPPEEGTDGGEAEDPAIDLGTPDTEGTSAPADEDTTSPLGPAAEAEDTPALPVVYGEEGLPTPVRDLRNRLIEVAKSGDIEALRPYIQPGEDGTVFSFGEPAGDPIAFLKSASGDGEGVEALAIMLEILQAGHVRQEPDSDNEIFVWPYFTGVAIDKLTKPQKVELFELVTAGDYQEMLSFGAYNFYRLGISPDGKLQFFVAGD